MKLEIEYWVDEEARDQGLGDIYIGDIKDIEDGENIVDYLIDDMDYAAAELMLDGEVIYGRDSDSTWGRGK